MAMKMRSFRPLAAGISSPVGAVDIEQLEDCFGRPMYVGSAIVVPENSSITTLVVPPCTPPPSGGSTGATGPQRQPQGLVLPARSKTATAPPCTVEQQQSSSG